MIFNRVYANIKDMSRRAFRSGFMLPTVIVAGTVTLIVLAYVLKTVSTSSTVTTNQNRQLLARQAAESGVARARACLTENNRVVTWTNDKPLTPNTDCFGNLLTSGHVSPYLLETGDPGRVKTRSYFEVRPSSLDDDYKNVESIGRLEFLNHDESEIRQTYEYKMLAYIKTDVTFSDIVFGSLFVANGCNDLYSRGDQKCGYNKSVYFFTKTHMGNISSVGYNMDGILTGFPNNKVIPWSQHLTSDPKEWYHTPYSLPNPLGNKIPVDRIITDFQGNGWVAFFLGTDGRTIYSTGSNINCDLGIGGNCNSSIEEGLSVRPTWHLGQSKMNLSRLDPDEKVVDIFYNSSTFLLTNKGKLYGSGNNNMSPGFGVNNLVSTFTRMPTLIEGGATFNSRRVVDFDTDSYFGVSNSSLAIAVTDDGKVYGWGKSPKGMPSAPGKSPLLILDPFATTGGVKIVKARTEGATIWALDELGRVWSAGNNEYGQLGRKHPFNTDTSFKQVPIPNSEKVVKITSDAFSALFLTEAGNVYSTGLNDQGQLGFESNLNNYNEYVEHSFGYFWNPVTFKTPCQKGVRRFEIPAGKKAKDIFIVSPGFRENDRRSSALNGSANQYKREADYYRNSFVITTEGEVYGAGSNRHGQLGVGAPGDNSHGYGGNPQEFSTPQKMILDYANNQSGTPGDEDKTARAKYVRSGIGTTIVITDRNHVFTVGNNNTGQLGSGDTKEYHVPMRHRYTNVFQTWYY